MISSMLTGTLLSHFLKCPAGGAARCGSGSDSGKGSNSAIMILISSRGFDSSSDSSSGSGPVCMVSEGSGQITDDSHSQCIDRHQC